MMHHNILLYCSVAGLVAKRPPYLSSHIIVNNNENTMPNHIPSFTYVKTGLWGRWFGGGGGAWSNGSTMGSASKGPAVVDLVVRWSLPRMFAVIYICQDGVTGELVEGVGGGMVKWKYYGKCFKGSSSSWSGLFCVDLNRVCFPSFAYVKEGCGGGFV